MGIYHIVLFDSFRLFQRPMNSSPMLKSRVIYCPFILVYHWIESEPAPVLFFFLDRSTFAVDKYIQSYYNGSRVRSKSQCIGCIRERLTVDVVDVCDGWPMLDLSKKTTCWPPSLRAVPRFYQNQGRAWSSAAVHPYCWLVTTLQAPASVAVFRDTSAVGTWIVSQLIYVDLFFTKSADKCAKN